MQTGVTPQGNGSSSHVDVVAKVDGLAISPRSMPESGEGPRKFRPVSGFNKRRIIPRRLRFKVLPDALYSSTMDVL